VYTVCFVIRGEWTGTPFRDQISLLTLNCNSNITKLIVLFLIADVPQQKGYVNFFKSLTRDMNCNILGSRTFVYSQLYFQHGIHCISILRHCIL